MVFAKIKQNGNRVIVRFQGRPTSLNESLEYLALLDKVYALNRPFIILYDARAIGWMPMAYIKQQAAYMYEREALTKKYMVRGAIVVSTPWAKRLLKALFTIKKPSAPISIFTSVEEAKEYLRNASLPQLSESVQKTDTVDFSTLPDLEVVPGDGPTQQEEDQLD